MTTVENLILGVAAAIREEVEHVGDAVNDLVAAGQPLDAVLTFIADEEKRVMSTYAGCLTRHFLGADRRTRRRIASAETPFLAGWRKSFDIMRSGARRACSVEADANAALLEALS